MQTPPNPNRPNFMNPRRGQDQQGHRNQMAMKFGSKYHLYKKQIVPPVVAQKQSVNKIMSQMKKQINFLQGTKWMFQNNDQLPTENFSPNPL